MADFIVSAVLPVLIDKLISETSRTIGRYKGIGADIKKWKKWLVQIQGALADASQKDINDDDVKEWLTDLQHLAYDVDDLLDGWATEAMHRDFTNESAATTSRVRKLIPTCCTSFSRSTRMLGELDNINCRFKDLLKRKKEFGFKGEGKSGLKVEGEYRPKNINQSSSVVDPSRIVGREVERKALVQQLLLGDRPSDQNYSVVPIIGMGGIGKTTLARLVYNDEQVSGHFELKAWVVVSDEFDSFSISKAIYENVEGGNKAFSDLNQVQVELVKQLRGKRFLLVLDNVWCESITDWKELVEPFYTCAPGSKIVITTRKQELLKKLGYKDLSQLQRLTDNDALCLFARHALGVDNFDSHLSLKPHGEDIIKKCDGLPLALIALGASLMTKDEDSWRGVVNSEIWTSEDCDVKKIIPALRLSYLDLSAHLKQLFAYCSLFPKDFLFNKEELVQLWMAEGFLTQLTPNNSTEERLGLTSFDELLSRTFFQHAPDNKSLFVMHDMMNDLAKFVAGEFFLRFDSESENGIKEETWEKYRHMSFVPETYVTEKKFKTFEKAKSLRTFLVSSLPGYKRFYLSDKIFAAVLPKLPLLRVLHLSNFSISEVPESIDTLRHLRYLNLSHTQITHLPENVCTLYNLQTLILSGCYSLIELPKSFLKLKNLRHFDISGTRILKMPFGIGELKSLQTLPKIIIGGENGFEIAKLKDLEKLCGKISIVNLDEVQDAKHAQEANFSQKVVSELEVEWSHDSRDKGLGKEVLNQLKPRSDKLIQLKIKSYRGLAFPSWVGDPSFLLLKHVSINGCSECASLPPLGQLPSLKELFIEKLDRVKVVGMELFGAGLAFPSLKILSFKNMLGWEKWSTNGEAMFPCLQELKLNSCNKLVDVSLGALPPLNVLEIGNCDSVVLRSLVQVTKAVVKLEMESISGLNDVVWRGVMEHVGDVEELSIMGCNEIRYLWELKAEALACKVLVKLRKLDVSRCDNLISLGEKEEEDNRRSNLLTSLMVLDVQSCNKMERLSCPDSIETLEVYYCSSITTISLPTRVPKLKSFKVMGCKKLLEREWGRQNMNNNRIEIVCITKWSNLKSIELTYLDHLTVLSIVNCKNLETFPDNALANLTSLKDLDIINCPRMDDCGVWPPNLHSLKIGKLKKPISKWSTRNFPTSLMSLELYGGFKDEVSSCSQFSDLLPLSLTSLGINGFEKLESIKEGLQHLTSLQWLSVSQCPKLKNLSYPQQLQHIYFYECPEMMDLPEDLLPSLLGLRIGNGCPKLKERCSEGGIYSSHISYIPFISISSRATHSGEAANKTRSLWAVALRRAQL